MCPCCCCCCRRRPLQGRISEKQEISPLFKFLSLKQTADVCQRWDQMAYFHYSTLTVTMCSITCPFGSSSRNGPPLKRKCLLFTDNCIILSTHTTLTLLCKDERPEKEGIYLTVFLFLALLTLWATITPKRCPKSNNKKKKQLQRGSEKFPRKKHYLSNQSH